MALNFQNSLRLEKLALNGRIAVLRKSREIGDRLLPMRLLARAASTLLCIASFCAAQTSSKRPLQLDDLYSMHEVSDPEMSPDGEWVAYTVSTIDKDADKRNTHIWMVRWDGTQNLQLTFDAESESSPRWSPDGKYISFVSSRPGKAKGSQVWVLDRRGGEARQITDVKGDISDYAWAPDSAKLLLIMKPKSEAEAEAEAAKPTPGAATPANAAETPEAHRD